MSDSDPPLLKELGESLKEPLNFIMKLTKLGVFAQNKSLPKSYKHSLPKIIVLDEASEGNRVMKGLVGLDLPTGFFFPIVVKFETDSTATCRKILFEYRCKDIHTEKKELVNGPNLGTVIFDKMKAVTDEKISDAEAIVTVVEPADVCSFMMIYLPRIHKQYDRVEDERQVQRFEDYVHRYTGDGRCLFLNVLSTSTSIDDTLSRQVLSRLDAQGMYTITVFTQLGLSTDLMTSEITSKKMSILTPFGYYFVKDDVETDKDKVKAKNQSQLLSRLDEKFIGFKSISKNLVLSLLAIIFSPHSQVTQSIDSHIKDSEIEISFIQKKFQSVTDASEKISDVVHESTLSLIKLFELHEYKEYEHSREMHAGAGMARRYKVFKSKMSNLKLDKEEGLFLLAEIDILLSRNWPLPATFVSKSISQALLEEQFRHASGTINSFVEDIRHFIEKVVVRVLLDHSKEHQQLHSFLRNVGRLSVEDLEENFKNKLNGLLELEKKFIYTSNELFEEQLGVTMDEKLNLQVEKNSDGKKFVNIPLLSGKMVRVDHLDQYHPTVVQKAFELKKLMTIYWDFIVERVVDHIVLNLQVSISEMLGLGIKKRLNEQLKVFGELPVEEPTVSFNKLTLTNRISDLKKAKEDMKKWQYEIQSVI